MHRAQRSQLVTKGPVRPSENSTTLGIRQVGHSEVMMARLALPRVHAKRPYVVSISAAMVAPLIMFLLLLPIVYSRYNSHILLKHGSVHSCFKPYPGYPLQSVKSQIFTLPPPPSSSLLFGCHQLHRFNLLQPHWPPSCPLSWTGPLLPDLLFSLPEMLFYRYRPSPSPPPTFAQISPSQWNLL